MDEYTADVDVDASGGTLAATFDDGSVIVFSRQVGNHEVWVAARSGGFHLHEVADGWMCNTTGEDLESLVNRVFEEQGGVPLGL